MKTTPEAPMTPQPQTPLPSFAELVRLGLAKARAKHGAMRNLHEAYAVILEELDEFWDEVKAQKIDPDAALKELVHVGAMVQRAAEDCSLIPPATVPDAALAEEVGRLTKALRNLLDFTSGKIPASDGCWEITEARAALSTPREET